MLQGKKLYKLFAGLMVVAMLLSACASSTTPTTARPEQPQLPQPSRSRLPTPAMPPATITGTGW